MYPDIHYNPQSEYWDRDILIYPPDYHFQFYKLHTQDLLVWYLEPSYLRWIQLPDKHYIMLAEKFFIEMPFQFLS